MTPPNLTLSGLQFIKCSTQVYTRIINIRLLNVASTLLLEEQTSFRRVRYPCVYFTADYSLERRIWSRDLPAIYRLRKVYKTSFR